MNLIILAISLVLLSGCGNPPLRSALTASSVSATPAPGATEAGARVIFHKDNFTTLDNYNPRDIVTPSATPSTTDYACAGDNLKVYDAEGGDYSAVTLPQVPFDTQAGDDLNPTYKPAFLKNVSVDITNSYYMDSLAEQIQSDVCSYRGVSNTPAPSYCADFDRELFRVATPTPVPGAWVISTPTPSPTPDWSIATGSAHLDPFFDTGFYRVRDDWCSYQGPIIDPDVDMTKSHVGGANIDIDRTQLGAAEDLLLNITYHAFNNDYYPSEWPTLNDAATPIDHHTVLKVQMIGTGQSLDSLLGVKQPRAWAYYESTSYPVYAKDISTFDDPYSGLRTEQVYVPLSKYPLVDRIRIERVRGTYILYEIDVYRMGERSVSVE